MPYYKKVKTKEKNNLSFSRLLQTPVKSFVHPIWWYHRRNVMSPKLVNNEMIAWIVFEYTPSCFQQKEQGPSAHLKTTHTDNSSMINFSMLTKSQCIVTFWKAAGFPFPRSLNLCDVQKLILFLSSWKLTESHLVNSFCFFFHWQTKGKDEICYWVLPPKNKDKQSPRKISLPETKQKKLLKLLVVSFWKFNVGLLQTLLHQEAREKVVEKIISNKGFKIKLLKMKQKNLSLQSKNLRFWP